MKKRERRRYLTEKYQQKQVRLANMYRSYRPYDSERYFQRPLAKKQRFLDRLRDNYVGREWDDRWRKSYTQWMIGSDLDGYTPEQLGRFRNHSFQDCGRPRCHNCGNPRRNSWYKKDRYTMQEHLSMMQMKDDLKYYYQYEEK